MAKSETVEGAIQSIRDHRERFERFCRSLSDEELGRPVPNSTWLVKDFISHLGSDSELVRAFQVAAEGRPEEATRFADGSPFDLDAWNEEWVTERRDWALERILEEAAGNRTALIAVLEGFREEQIGRKMRFVGDNKRSPADLPLRVFLLGWSLHDPIHAADMLKALPERANDPELAAWINHPVVNGYQQAMSGPPRR